jgi:Flp pilus assembly protein TadD
LSKQPDRALADANDAIRLDPRNAMAYKLRGGIFGGMGRRDQAIADFRNALELSPADEGIKTSLRELGATP